MVWGAEESRGFGMEGIACPHPALCRCIWINATALLPHFTELTLTRGLIHSVPGLEGRHGPSPTRSHRGGCLSSRVSRGRAWIREKPLSTRVSLVPANIRDSQAPEMPSSPTHPSHPPP